MTIYKLFICVVIVERAFKKKQLTTQMRSEKT